MLPLLLAPLAAGLLAEPRPFTMSDLAAGSAAGVDVAYGDMDATFILLGRRDVDLFMVQLAGDVAVTPEVKIVLRMPFTYVSCECFGSNAFNADDDQFALGNLTVGGRYVLRQGDLSLAGGGSYSGLTASDDFDNEGRAAALTELWSLFRDPGLWLPNTHTFRGTADARYAFGRPYLQAEVGLHYHLVDDDDDFGSGANFTVLRLVAGGGFKVTERVALQAELVTTSLVLDDDDDDAALFGGDEWFHVLDVGGRWEAPSVSLGLRLSIPLDDGGSDLIDDAIGFGVDALARF